MSCVLYKMVSLMSHVMCSFSYRFFVTFFDNNNPAFHKTNSSGKTLDTRQKIFCAPLHHPPLTKQPTFERLPGLVGDSYLICRLKAKELTSHPKPLPAQYTILRPIPHGLKILGFSTYRVLQKKNARIGFV